MKPTGQLLKELLMGVLIITLLMLLLWVSLKKQNKNQSSDQTFIWDKMEAPSSYRAVYLDGQQVLVPIE